MFCLLCSDPADIQHWHARGRGKHAFLQGHRFLEKRPDQQKVGKPGKGNRTLNSEFEN